MDFWYCRCKFEYFNFIAFYTIELTPTIFSPQAYTIIAVFNCMRMSMGLLPFSVKAVAEGKVALTRLKVRLLNVSLILSKDNYLSFVLNCCWKGILFCPCDFVSLALLPALILYKFRTYWGRFKYCSYKWLQVCRKHISRVFYTRCSWYFDTCRLCLLHWMNILNEPDFSQQYNANNQTFTACISTETYVGTEPQRLSHTG